MFDRAAALYFSSVWNHVSAPVSLRPHVPNTQSALIGQLTQAWANTADNNKAAGRTTDEAFQEQRFLWERGACVGLDFVLFNFQDLLQSQEPIWNKKASQVLIL